MSSRCRWTKVRWPNARSKVTTSDWSSGLPKPSIMRSSEPHMMRAAKIPLSLVPAARTARTKAL